MIIVKVRLGIAKDDRMQTFPLYEVSLILSLIEISNSENFRS